MNVKNRENPGRRKKRFMRKTRGKRVVRFTVAGESNEFIYEVNGFEDIERLSSTLTRVQSQLRKTQLKPRSMGET